PMLASSAPTVGEAFDKIGAQAAVDLKLDGIRIQAHKRRAAVSLFTRSLDDITARLPSVVARVAELPADSLILDGEVIALDASGAPRPFQDTASRTATQDAADSDTEIAPFFFDCLHLGDDLIDRPFRDRIDVLTDTLPPELLVPR